MSENEYFLFNLYIYISVITVVKGYFTVGLDVHYVLIFTFSTVFVCNNYTNQFWSL